MKDRKPFFRFRKVSIAIMLGNTFAKIKPHRKKSLNYSEDDGHFSIPTTEIKPPIMAFSEVFIQDKQTMWSAFRKRMQQFDIPEDFQTINRGVQAFLMPIHNEVTATMCWSPDTGWTAH